MKPFSSRPVRTYLFMMILIVVVPCALITLYGSMESWTEEIGHANEIALQLARSAAFQQERVVENAHQLLATLSQFPQVREFKAQESAAMFGLLVHYNPYYQNIILTDLDGYVRASAAPVLTVNVSTSKYFRDVIGKQAFSIGEYVRSVYANKAVIHYAYPVFDAGNRLRGVLAIAFDLMQYGQLFSEVKLPVGSALALTDWKGTRLYRFPHAEKYEGLPDLPEMIEKLSGSESEGAFTAAGVDGVVRCYGFSRLARGDDKPYLYIRVGIPRDVTLADAKWVLIRNIVLLVLVLAFSLGATWLISYHLIMKKMNMLVKEANELMRGNLHARAGIAHDHTEFGLLACALDKMATALEKRIMESEYAKAAISASLKEKEVLLKEVHHRVKNNLQIISSLMSLQTRRIQDPVVLDVFRVSQARVRSIALVHEKLYQSSSFVEINFLDYVNSLAVGLSRSLGITEGPVSLSMDIPGTQVSLTMAVPCGLIINELISNALKHAFPGGKGGEVFVGFSRNRTH